MLGLIWILRANQNHLSIQFFVVSVSQSRTEYFRSLSLAIASLRVHKQNMGSSKKKMEWVMNLHGPDEKMLSSCYLLKAYFRCEKGCSLFIYYFFFLCEISKINEDQGFMTIICGSAIALSAKTTCMKSVIFWLFLYSERSRCR